MLNEQLFLEIIRRQHTTPTTPSVAQQSCIAGGLILALLVAIGLGVMLALPATKANVGSTPGYPLDCGEREDSEEYDSCIAYVNEQFSVEQ